MASAHERPYVGGPGRQPRTARKRDEEKLSHHRDEKDRETADSALDGMGEDSFPASDPPTVSGAHAGPPRCHPPVDAPKHKKG